MCYRNEAAILAARRDKDIIERAELLEAIKRVNFLSAFPYCLHSTSITYLFFCKSLLAQVVISA